MKTLNDSAFNMTVELLRNHYKEQSFTDYENTANAIIAKVEAEFGLDVTCDVTRTVSEFTKLYEAVFSE